MLCELGVTLSHLVVNTRAFVPAVLDHVRAYVCMLEDEIDSATQSLAQHSASKSPELMMLRCALLFRSNRPTEASALTLDWLRSATVRARIGAARARTCRSDATRRPRA